MKFFSSPFLLIVLFSLVLTSCTEDILVEFSVNRNQNLVASVGTPATKDLLPIYQIDNDISAIASDLSVPNASVTSRQWFLIKDEKATDLRKDSVHVHLSFEESGVYGLMLKINGEKESAVTHWLDVHVSKSNSLIPDDESTDEHPNVSEDNFSFVQPRRNQVVNEKKYTVVIDADIYSQDFDGLKLTLNGRTQKSAFDAATGQISSDVRLKIGNNSIKLVAENFELEQTVEYSISKPARAAAASSTTASDVVNSDDSGESTGGSGGGTQADNGSDTETETETEKEPETEPTIVTLERVKPPGNPIGYSLSGLDESCFVDLGTEYTFTITPTHDIELEEMTIFTDLCGGVKLKLSSKEGNETTTEGLNPGKNQISLIGLYPELTAGVTYTLKLTTLANVNGCAAANPPNISTMKSNCGQSKKSQNSAIVVDYKGKAAIFNLKYSYSN